MHNNRVLIIGAALILTLAIALAFLIGFVVGEYDSSYGALLRLARQLYRDGQYDRAEAIVNQLITDGAHVNRATRLLARIENKRAQQGDDLTRADNEQNTDTDIWPLLAGDRQGQIDQYADHLRDNSQYTTDDSDRQINSANAPAQPTPAEPTPPPPRVASADSLSRSLVNTLDGYLREGSELLDDGKYGDSRNMFSRVLDENLKDRDQNNRYHSIAHARTGDTYIQQAVNTKDRDLLGNAATSVRDALRADQSNWEAHYIEGKLAVENGDNDTALASFERARALNPDDPNLLFALANSQYRAGDYPSARDTYMAVLRIDGRYQHAHHNLGNTYLQLNDTRNAINTLNAGLRIYRNDHRLNFRIGGVYLDQGTLDSAITHLSKAASARPRSALYNARLGSAFFEQNNLTAARDAYKKAVQYAPDNNDYQYNLAAVYNRLHEYRLGKIHIDRALMGGSDPRYHYTHGQILYGLGQRQEALAALEKAVEARPTYSEALAEIGNIYVENGQEIQGLNYLERAYRINARSPEINNRLGNVYLQLQEYDKAADFFQTATSLHPNRNEYRYNLALAYIELDDYRQAVPLLTEIIDSTPDYWRAYEKIGEIYITQGEKQEARDILERLLARNPKYDNRDAVERLLVNL